jgi:uncharacterized protein
MEKPSHIFGRSAEWSALADFAAAGPPGQLRLGLVYGRRRQGKSMLTSELAEAMAGFHWEAIDTELADNLTELSRAWSAHTGAAGASRFESWDDALRTILSADGQPRLVVLDEIQRVIGKLPTFPSLVQRIIGPPGLGDRTAQTRLLLCGSAFGEMRRLIDGRAPLRGRAMLDLVVRPFDYREAADYWGLTANPLAALTAGFADASSLHNRACFVKVGSSCRRTRNSVTVSSTGACSPRWPWAPAAGVISKTCLVRVPERCSTQSTW